MDGQKSWPLTTPQVEVVRLARCGLIVTVLMTSSPRAPPFLSAVVTEHEGGCEARAFQAASDRSWGIGFCLLKLAEYWKILSNHFTDLGAQLTRCFSRLTGFLRVPGRFYVFLRNPLSGIRSKYLHFTCFYGNPVHTGNKKGLKTRDLTLKNSFCKIKFWSMGTMSYVIRWRLVVTWLSGMLSSQRSKNPFFRNFRN